MATLPDIFAFLSVIIRGVVLVTQSFMVGGIAFLLLMRGPVEELGSEGELVEIRASRFLLGSALAFTVAELAFVAVQCAVLMATVDIGLADVLGADFSVAGLMLAGAGLVCAWVVRTPLRRAAAVSLGALAAAVLLAQVATSHAMARLDDRAPLAVADVLHMAGAAVWIGGIPYFLLALAGTRTGAGWRRIGKRFSLMAMGSVAVLLAGGLAMAIVYLGSLDALYGTAYGVMVGTKAGLLAGLLFLGGMNFLVVERLRRDPGTSILRLKRFAEVEVGIGLTVLFAAASLTSQPPGADLTQDRASFAEVVDRFVPQWPPRLSSPDRTQLMAYQIEIARQEAAKTKQPLPLAFTPGSGVLPPRDAGDIAWSEYNHHWAGIAVLLIGVLALGERSGMVPWARHWPLLFVGLAVFLLFRSDPEVWPLGDIGFFASFKDPEVAQHRVFVALIAGFGIFEWCVRTGRIRAARAALVFPLITAVAGALLLTHQHALSNVKDQMLIEVTHAPLALFGVTAGWARWLELRLDQPGNRIAGWIWPIAFVLVGVILLIYHET
ncbi:MAG TPA: CopD family protein [Stellaceae bacterium]|nr:CopD family protein [Stellaceae bacterium]